MGYSQWIRTSISPQNIKVSIKNAQLRWGKFHEDGNKYSELSKDTINNIVIDAGQTAVISSCGPDGQATGTQGSFDIYCDGKQIATYSWDCPWGNRPSTSTLTVHDKVNYGAYCEGGNLGGGAIGNVYITTARA